MPSGSFSFEARYKNRDFTGPYQITRLDCEINGYRDYNLLNEAIKDPYATNVIHERIEHKPIVMTESESRPSPKKSKTEKIELTDNIEFNQIVIEEEEDKKLPWYVTAWNKMYRSLVNAFKV